MPRVAQQEDATLAMALNSMVREGYLADWEMVVAHGRGGRNRRQWQVVLPGPQRDTWGLERRDVLLLVALYQALKEASLAREQATAAQ